MKELAIPDRPTSWNINSLHPELSDLELAEKLATYFVTITDEFEPIERNAAPVTFSSPFDLLMPHQVAERICADKTVKSALDGDILPTLKNPYSDIIAIPATRIINYCLQSARWPEPWLVETQSVIPKCDNASSFDQLRNLSCTNSLSKTLESFVIDKLRGEICLRSNQFGGLKGSGAAHFLVECWDRILRSTDTHDSAAALLSIDFSKAFNRMDHTVCVGALADLGASTESLGMIVAFLTGRSMVFKVNGTKSSPRTIRGGSPQGTKLGNLLFIASINKIEDGLRDPPPTITDDVCPEDDDGSSVYGLRQLAGRIGAVRRFNSGVVRSSTPMKLATTDGVMRYLDNSGRENSDFITENPRDEDPLDWPPLDAWTGKYVDDVNIEERLYLGNAISTFSQNKEIKEVHAGRCEDIFNVIATNASQVGMRVNTKKTRLLCITPAIHGNVNTYIHHRGETIRSEDSMVLLGFKFGNRPSVAAHVDFIREKFNSRAWMVRHLVQSGVPSADVVSVYASVIRPVIEYVTPAFASLLTKGQCYELEKMQQRVLKTIFGFQKTYREAMEIAGLVTLEDRRQETMKKFAGKTVANPSYSHWFPECTPACYDLRKPKKYREFHANTDRLFRSPLFHMRRLLNE